MTDLKHQIEASLAGFKGKDLKQAAIAFLNTLGYRSEKVLDLENTPEAFLAQFDRRDRPCARTRPFSANGNPSSSFFRSPTKKSATPGHRPRWDSIPATILKNYQSYLFLALDLENGHYTRTDLSTITREVNRLFDMPAMLLLRQNGTLTFSVIDRRISKRDESRDVLEKVKLIKDIRYENPHRAHTEILHDLSLPALMEKHECRDFMGLHEAWRKTLDTNELNKRFYRELADWYFWALQHVEFPADIEKDTPTRNATSVIRLLTRLIFCWFIKEKGLISNDLFNETKLQQVLKSLKPEDHSFYRAILQNLFFGTLNQRMNVGGEQNRKFTQEGSFENQRDEYGVKNLVRYKDLFAISEEEAIRLFENIPFLNGGLFDCLDKEDESEKKNVLYVDGFSRNPRKQPKVPNFLFFSDYQTLDLSNAYGDTKRKKEKVRGLINLLDSYKFTVTENTPIEEEIALDPELLGKVFENLLASYNPETGTTARKQTGSFYTPREIVNYMVDESLIAYLKGELTADRADAADEEDQKNPRESASCSVEQKLRQLFAYTDEPHQFSESEIAALVDAVDAAKILDPACGSGAFPMGILHKLVFILGKVDPGNERWKQKQIDKLDSASMREELEQTFLNNDDDFSRKLCLIENCIYGVDIQPIAIQISKLRFFISLICDQRTNTNKAQNCGVRPLPNLETKFVAANTLIALEKQDGLLKDQRLVKLEKDLESVRHKHFSAQRRRDKLDLQRRDRDLREQIAAVLKDGGMSSDASRKLAAWNPYDQNESAPFFDPEWMFGVKDGFDVVIGNPPYVRIQTLKQQDPTQVAFFGNNYIAASKGNYDLYVVFVERALQLLASNGQSAYILPHKFFNAQYGEPLRALLATGRHLKHVVHFGDQQVFPGATNYVCLLFLAKAGADACRFVRVENLEQWFTTFLQGTECAISTNRVTASEWNFAVGKGAALFDRLQRMPVKLGDVADRISQGIRTSANEVYVLDVRAQKGGFITACSKQLEREVMVESKAALRFLQGREIKAFCIAPSAKVVLMPYRITRRSAELLNLSEISRNWPMAFDYLSRNKNYLSDREDGRFRGTAWHQFGRTQNIDLMLLPKILVPDIADRAAFALDEGGEFAFTSGYGITLKPDSELSFKYFLAILNSRLLDGYWKHISTPLRGGFYRYFTQFIEQLPIQLIDFGKPSEKKTHDALITLVDRILAAKKADPGTDTSALEGAIDQLVYQLYGLTPEEINIVEGAQKV